MKPVAFSSLTQTRLRRRRATALDRRARQTRTGEGVSRFPLAVEVQKNDSTEPLHITLTVGLLRPRGSYGGTETDRQYRVLEVSDSSPPPPASEEGSIADEGLATLRAPSLRQPILGE